MDKAIYKGRLVYLPTKKKYAQVLSRNGNKIKVKTIPDGEIIEVVEKGLLVIQLLKSIWSFIKRLFKKND